MRFRKFVSYYIRSRHNRKLRNFSISYIMLVTMILVIRITLEREGEGLSNLYAHPIYEHRYKLTTGGPFEKLHSHNNHFFCYFSCFWTMTSLGQLFEITFHFRPEAKTPNPTHVIADHQWLFQLMSQRSLTMSWCLQVPWLDSRSIPCQSLWIYRQQHPGYIGLVLHKFDLRCAVPYHT